jgi:hypothetical protein
MRFELVSIAPSGPLTFTCNGCGGKVQQDNGGLETPYGREYRLGKVWADLDGEAFRDYFCTSCKTAQEFKR